MGGGGPRGICGLAPCSGATGGALEDDPTGASAAAAALALADALDDDLPPRVATIKRLILDGCFNIGDRGMASMVRRCRDLTELSISVRGRGRGAVCVQRVVCVAGVKGRKECVCGASVACDVGHGAWGMGHGAWGIGHEA